MLVWIQTFVREACAFCALPRGKNPYNLECGVNIFQEREIEILKLIADGFTNKVIGEKLFISHRTVDTHRTNLMRKLGVNNIAGLINFAIKNQLIS